MSRRQLLARLLRQNNLGRAVSPRHQCLCPRAMVGRSRERTVQTFKNQDIGSETTRGMRFPLNLGSQCPILGAVEQSRRYSPAGNPTLWFSVPFPLSQNPARVQEMIPSVLPDLQLGSPRAQLLAGLEARPCPAVQYHSSVGGRGRTDD